jgi:hypothetical protein
MELHGDEAVAPSRRSPVCPADSEQMTLFRGDRVMHNPVFSVSIRAFPWFNCSLQVKRGSSLGLGCRTP